MGDIECMLFPQHFLKIEEEMVGKGIVGFATLPYTTTLERYVRSKSIK